VSEAARSSYLADAQATGVPGAAPLTFVAVDLREDPDHPEHRFDLEVPAGAVLACLGDEDSGVGALGRYVLGLERPLAGRVLVFGTDVGQLAYYPLLTFRRRVGYTQAGDGLLQNLTLRANIALPLSYASDHRPKEIEGRVETLVDALGLRHVAHLRPAAANEEDRRRTAVARSLALDPELLVMEAPFDGLTARAAKEIMEQARVRADGTPRTVFLTAQELFPSVTGLLSRVVLVVDGQAVGGAT
jgi:ABC-type transporter Mla maintaining outer membrane lipid asymmetry ATPase subunit MlaF